MLEVEAQLVAEAAVPSAVGTSASDALNSGATAERQQQNGSASETGGLVQSAGTSSNGVAPDAFYSSGKTSTWKALKKMVKHKKEGSTSEVCVCVEEGCLLN